MSASPRRGEMWTAVGGEAVSKKSGYVAKPRVVLILQDDHFAETGSVTVALVTTHDDGAPLFRMSAQATDSTGLERDSFVMVDKITTIRRERLGGYVGRLPVAVMVQVERALATFLGLAG